MLVAADIWIVGIQLWKKGAMASVRRSACALLAGMVGDQSYSNLLLGWQLCVIAS
jgi:hypothetical protein